MNDDGPQPPVGAPPHRGVWSISNTILVFGLPFLVAVSVFIWLYAELGFFDHPGQRAPGPWASGAWAATWVLTAAFGIFSLVAPGLILCIHPAQFARVPGDTTTLAALRWPRPYGLAMVWGGGWIIAFALIKLAQPLSAPGHSSPPTDGMPLLAICALATAPAFALKVVDYVTRRLSRQQPTAEDEPPQRRD